MVSCKKGMNHVKKNIRAGTSFPLWHSTKLLGLRFFKSLPNDQILAWSKLKAFADDISKVTEMIISVFDRVESMVGKGEDVGY